MTRRVVITGAGFISPLGCDRQDLWDNLAHRRSAVQEITSVPTGALAQACAAEVKDFTDAVGHAGPLEKAQMRAIKKNRKVMCREIAMGVAAAQRALTDAGLSSENIDPERTGCIFGSDYIMTQPNEFTDAIRQCQNEDGAFDFDLWGQRGLPNVDPLWLLKYLPNMPNSHIAIYNDLRGPNNAVTMREASSNLAVAEAWCTIVRGAADVLLTGATGTRLHPMRTVHITIQEEVASANGAAPENLCRPFDLNRRGMVMGEGAGAMVLEELSSAQRRGANILGEVVGYGSSTVSRQGVACCGAALRNVILQTLRSAKVAPGDVGHIHAHGLSTRKCDAEEAKAIHEVFGERSSPVPVVAAKSYFGNLGAGGGMVELIASAYAMQEGALFPLLNYETPDPECPITPVTADDVPAGACFLNLNVTPQGQASAVLVRKFVD